MIVHTSEGSGFRIEKSDCHNNDNQIFCPLLSLINYNKTISRIKITIKAPAEI